MYLSIVIPAYNEEKRIGATLSNVYDFLTKKDYDYEVILVDDGSADNTVARAEESRLFRKGKLTIVKNEVNKGKGFSVRIGIAESEGDYILFTDADLSTPIEELDKLFNHLKDGFDIVIGSRGTEGADVRIHQPWYRESMGKAFNIFVKMLLLKDFKDTQCGFKLFKKQAAKEIEKEMHIRGFCFDVEMLYIAKQKNYSVQEIGVIWNNSLLTKVKAISSSASMFFDLLKIRKLHKS